MRRPAAVVLATFMVLQAGAVPAAGAEGQGLLREVCVVVVVAEGARDEDVAELLANGEAAVVSNPVACGIDAGRPFLSDADDGAVKIDEAVEGLLDVRSVPWQRLVIHPDGKSLDIHFMAGIPQCTALDRVEVEPSPTGLDVRVFIGVPRDARACPAIARKYVVTVELDTVLFAGGIDPPTGVDVG